VRLAREPVTPTNLLFNVIATPGALLRYRRNRQFDALLARLLLAGTVPGVVAGAAVRVFLLPGARTFRIVAGLVLLALGTWLISRTLQAPRTQRPLSDRTILATSLGGGVVGGVYGIDGGSILSPVLVGSGLAVAVVAPAAMAATFVSPSWERALTYAVLALVADGSIAPDWPTGIACGLGGLRGGYLGAQLQPRLPERVLRLLLGALAVGIAVLYLVQGFR
jgi:uncharacterized membrane protein YfcA